MSVKFISAKKESIKKVEKWSTTDRQSIKHWRHVKA